MQPCKVAFAELTQCVNAELIQHSKLSVKRPKLLIFTIVYMKMIYKQYQSQTSGHISALMCYIRGDIVFEKSIHNGIIIALICSPHADPPALCFGFLRSQKHSIVLGTI